ncbi:hypothetical protein [Phytoactinopolyspora alkaliphila]|nr:hypothetical protein [Phytoactinopolyspora alkaliphila]
MRTALGSLGAALVLALAGCGADDDAGPSATTTPEPAASSADPAPAESTPTDIAPTPEDTVPPVEPDPERTSPGPTDQPQPTRSPSDRLTPTPQPTGTQPPLTGEVPAGILDDVVADAADRAGTAPGDVVVVRAQAVQWPDGSLGCPEPGMMYTQAIVDGYWVELEAEGKTYDYRLNEQGTFRLCTTPGLEPPPNLRERS